MLYSSTTDYFLLNWLGTPWGRSKAERKEATPQLSVQPGL
jgi:hypothetical protein